MNHAVPVTYCLNCDKSYLDLTDAYQAINTAVDEKNTSCKSQYFDLDRLNIVQRSFMAAANLWTGGHCDSCYASPLVFSNSTLKFLDLLDVYNGCTRQNRREVCTACLGSYTDLNKQYEAIKVQDNDAACFDLQDKINGSRRYWSIDVQCNTNPDEKQITFLILTAVVTALPICFYVLMFAHAHQSESDEDTMNILNESSIEPVEEEDQSSWTARPDQPSINVGTLVAENSID